MQKKRTINRTKARELTPEEAAIVAGGAPSETPIATNIGPNGDTETRFDY
ncbi:hypothetical protein ACFSUK_28270 [Sphingobium scionense]|uniref:Uncharacterized protein n=2 Tax=Sphingobium TaxID=165695 RepID=A0AA42X044_SPHYA|nr:MULTISPECIES: hypothetical protein [Sphingobium]MBB4148087.1 hypothetical protein [Sphingobium scionense]MDH2133953.1 hypothetical protein [Sphingobium yanoikuyae]MDH2153410.1 hypothetical protein [Sphingobium yanoikuyae]MDH2169345.1 hypothetical protein [Sphingobium yanoikuyae]